MQIFLYIAISKRKRDSKNNKYKIKIYCNKIVHTIAIFIAQNVISQTIITKYSFAIFENNNKELDKLIVLVLIL